VSRTKLDSSDLEIEIKTILVTDEGRIVVPDAQLLFDAQFERSGADLFLVNDGFATLRVADYFTDEQPADIYSPDGAVLHGAQVVQLAGPLAPGQYAQTGPLTGTSPIGQVETLSGGAAVQRADGTVETLQVGIKIFQNDVIRTDADGVLSVTFVDGTIFTLASGSRMIIDELIYDPDGADNSGSFSLIQGGFVFIAGQVAKTGTMDINTPSATMGIRGTTVLVDIQTENGVVTSEVTLTRDPDGGIGEVVLRDLDGQVIANITGSSTKWIISTVDGETQEIERSALDLAEDNVLIAEAFSAYQSAFTRVENGDTFVTLGDPSSRSGIGGPGTPNGSDLQLDSVDEPDNIDPDGSDAPPDDKENNGTFEEGRLKLEGEIVAVDLTVAGQEDVSITGAITGVIQQDGNSNTVAIFQLGTGPGNGTAEVLPDGSFSYVPETDFNGRDSFTYQVADSEGNVEVGTVTVDVSSVNDAPQLENSSATVTEDSVVSGTIVGSDVDGDTLQYNLEAGADHGQVVLLQTGAFSYTPDPNFSGVDSFLVRVSDAAGASAVAAVNVTVTGENDTPEITTAAGEAIGSVSENVNADTVSGTLSATDADIASVLTWTGSEQGNLGQFVISESGVWEFTLDSAAADSLSANQIVTESFTATVTDDQGATAEQLVTVTINGANDPAQIGGDTAGQLTEDAVANTVSGDLGHTDVDGNNAADVFRPQTSSTASDQGYGSFTVNASGVWIYTLNNAHTAVTALAPGQTLSDTFTVQAQDGTEQLVSVTINGANDSAQISGDTAGQLTEDAALITVSGDLGHTDVDGTNGADVFRAQTSSTASDLGYGSFTVNASGVWIYTLNNAHATVTALAPGQTLSDTFTVQAEDGTEQLVTVTINGANDLPTITTPPGAESGTVTEGSETTSVSGQLSASDPDAGIALTWSGSAAGLYGAFALAADGSWTYTLDNGAADALSEGQIVTENFATTVTDDLGGTAGQTVTVTIIGTNDLPVVSKKIIIEVTLNEAHEGTLTATDVDSAGSFTFAPGASGPLNGQVDINSDGTYTYTPDAGFQGLDTFEFAAMDSDGGVSTGLVTVEVESVGGTGANGQVVSLDIHTEATPDAPAGSVAITTSAIDATSINLVIAMDRSGSIGNAGWEEQTQAVADALEILAAQFAGAAGNVDVKIITYATDVQVLSTMDLQDPTLSAAVRNLPFTGGSTNWSLALNETEDFLASQPTDEANFLFFITDGNPTSGDWQTALADLTDVNANGFTVNIEAFGIGTGFNEATLSQIDPTPTLLDSADDLVGALTETPIFNPQLIDFKLTLDVDGVSHGVIADETNPAFVSDGLNYEISLAEIVDIETLLGEANRFSATVRFDLDGDQSTAEIELFSTELMSASDTAQLLSGMGQSDLLLGSTQNDQISGNGGNDLMMGFAGDDVLNGGQGVDIVLAGSGDDRLIVDDLPTGGREIIDGGDGRDTLVIDLAGDINSSLFPVLSISGIEVLDIENGLANSLNLTLSDVIGFSDTPDTELETLLGKALPESAVIYGDVGDTLTLTGGPGGGFEKAPGDPVIDSAGHSLTIFQYVEGGNILATLGVDDDVVVTTVPVA
jgi:VCBS repeat-containing protein